MLGEVAIIPRYSMLFRLTYEIWDGKMLKNIRAQGEELANNL
jgi:hypothetical protein